MAEALRPPASRPWASLLPCSHAFRSTRTARQPTNSLYLGTVFTLIVLPTVVRHLVTYQVGLPVKSFGALVTLVLPLLAVRQHMLLQAVGTRTAPSEVKYTDGRAHNYSKKSPKGQILTDTSPLSTRFIPAMKQNILLPTRITHRLVFCHLQMLLEMLLPSLPKEII